MLLQSQCIHEQVQEENRKYFETNAKWKHNFSKSIDEAKAVLTEKFIATQEKSLKNYPTTFRN